MCDNHLRAIHANKQRGSILLMTLLVLSAIVTAAGTVSIITVQHIRNSSLIDDGVRAFYAAESGIEHGLYAIRKQEISAASIATASGALSNGGTWDRIITSTVASLASDIAEDDTWQVDLYNPDDSLSQLDTAIQSITINWDHDAAGGSEWVLATIVPWDAGTGTPGIPTAQLFSAVSANPMVNLSAAQVHRVRIKALYADVQDVAITAYDQTNGAGSVVNIPASITMYSTGEYAQANSVVRATMPQKTPLSGVFNFVLFAEEDVYK